MSCSLCGEPTQEQTCPEVLQPMEGSTLEQETRVEEGMTERSCYGLAVTPCSPFPLHRLGEIEELGMKE